MQSIDTKVEGEGVVVFTIEHWDCRSSFAYIKSATTCHDGHKWWGPTGY